MKTFLLLAFAYCLFTSCAHATPPEARIEQLIQAMTLDEKVSLVSGNDFDTHAIPRLAIPAIKMTDGPLGVRWENNTAFPSGISLGATFNPALAKSVAAAIAEEARFRGRNMLLGPCVNISRQPFGGRNFESFGEDPFLTASLAADYVRGIQSQNVLASVKHFAANDQEFERFSINVNVDERALFEIYFPAFEAAVKAGTWTVMSSYNKVNGFWSSENDYLLKKILKGRWGFRGFVVSDWVSTHHTVLTANNGLDLEMPTGEFWGNKLTDAVRSGEVAMSTLDDKVRRILRAMFAVGIIDASLVTPAPPAAGPESPAHRTLALQTAQESLVLLKNENNILPINRAKRIAVLGPNAGFSRSGGGGSSHVEPFATSTALQGLQNRLHGAATELLYAPGVFLQGDMPGIPQKQFKPLARSRENGLTAEYFSNPDLSGTPILTRLDKEVKLPAWDEEPRLSENYSIRWSGFVDLPKTGRYRFSTLSDDGIRLFLDGKEIIADWNEHATKADDAVVEIKDAGWHSFRLEYFNGGGGASLQLGWETPGRNYRQEALSAAKSADIAVIFAGLGNDIESEGYDRSTMEMPLGQADFIREVAALNPNTVVVLNSGSPLMMGDWIGKVKAVVQAWYPGQEGGYAIADVLLGKVNPSGKLPVSFLKRWEDSPAYGNYPGENGQVHYAEGIFIGYRHYDTAGIAPEFPFGHGLSYTTFAYDDLHVNVVNAGSGKPDVRVEFNVRNSGKVAGAEVAQLYVGEQQPSLPRPFQELKGFRKVWLSPGESKRVSFKLNLRSFAYFDVRTMSWRAASGAYRLRIGASSRDVRLESTVSLH